MHRSRLSTFVIDCEGGDLQTAATFWGAALGRKVRPPGEEDERYRDLVTPASEPLVMVQRVEHPSRIHLDIEADDLIAEVERLEALGARRVEQIRTWWVMEAPTGHRFCVVRPQRGPLGDDANLWP